MSARRRLVLAVLLIGGALLIFLLPFSLLLLPNPEPQRVNDLGAAPTGIYLRTGQDTLRVFPYASAQGGFPQAAPVVGRESVMLVKYRNLGPLGGYAVRAFPSGEEVAVERVVRAPEQLLELRPKSLPAGRYYVTKTREGMWGGTDYVYFSVE